MVVWSPDKSIKFREEILRLLGEGFGKRALECMIFLTNKVTKKWEEEEEGEATKKV